MSREIVLTKKKEMDLFSRDGLIKQTGTRPFRWDIYILKELIDNAINTSTNAKVITLLKSALEEISKISDFVNPV